MVTVGQPISEYTAKMFARNEYRDYLEVHGLSVQLTEALAEYWHRRVRSELILPNGAAVGATAGVLAGGRKARQNQAAKTQQAQTTQTQSMDTYYRAYGACMQGRGYTVN